MRALGELGARPTPTGAHTKRIASATFSAAGYTIRIYILQFVERNTINHSEKKEASVESAAESPISESRCPYSIYCNHRDWKKGAEHGQASVVSGTFFSSTISPSRGSVALLHTATTLLF